MLAAALVACGGGDDPEASLVTTTTDPADESLLAPLDGDEFVAQANAVCASTQESLASLEAALQGETDRDRLAAAIAEQLVPALRAQADAIDALGAPAAVADEVDDILEAIRARLGPIEDDPVGQLLEATVDPFGDLNDRLSALGLTVCAGEA